MSKKTFKKAIGGLYKDGLVALDDGGVRLTGKNKSGEKGEPPKRNKPRVSKKR